METLSESRSPDTLREGTGRCPESSQKIPPSLPPLPRSYTLPATRTLNQATPVLPLPLEKAGKSGLLSTPVEVFNGPVGAEYLGGFIFQVLIKL